MYTVQGRILFARRGLEKGEVVAVEQRDSIITRCFSGVEELELHMAGVQVGRFEYRTIVTNVACVEDKKALLEHCCPVVATGQVAEQNMEHFNAFFSHSSQPNCDQHCARFTAQQFRQGPVNIISTQYLHNIYYIHNIRITATRAISAGEELTVSYDQSVGYEECGEVIIIIIIIILVIITVNRWRWWRSSWRSAASTGWRRDRPASPCPS